MLYLIAGILLGLSAGIHIGLYFKWFKDKLNDILNRDPEPTPQVITPRPPGFADVNELSAIVTPKSPYEIEREERARAESGL